MSVELKAAVCRINRAEAVLLLTLFVGYQVWLLTNRDRYEPRSYNPGRLGWA